MRTSRKGLRLKFYTQEQTNELIAAIESKSYKNDRAIAKYYSEKFNRSIDNVYAKIRTLNGKKIKVYVPVDKTKPKAVKTAKIEVIEETVKPLTLPQGMTYQGKAKKVELHADHFRVYF